MTDHTMFSGRTAEGNPFTVLGDPDMGPESRAALEQMVDLAYAQEAALRELFRLADVPMPPEDPKNHLSGTAKRLRMRG